MPSQSRPRTPMSARTKEVQYERQLNASRNSCLQDPQRTRAKPCFKIPQARNLSTTSPTTDRQYPQRRVNRSSYTVLNSSK